MKTYICLLWVVFGCIGWEMHASVDVHPTFITTSDGLANNSVRYLFQDSKGFIWMGTLDGLSRYDGHSFVTFRPESGDKISLANHHVKKIQEDRNGFLWFITAPELMSCYDLKHDCFVDFTGCDEKTSPLQKTNYLELPGYIPLLSPETAQAEYKSKSLPVHPHKRNSLH